MHAVGFRVLGPLAVERAGAPVDVGGPKPRAVLERLLLDLGRPVRATQLIDAVWQGRPPATAVKTLHKYVSVVRAALVERDLLVTERQGYALMASPDQVDAARFERLVDEAADGVDPGTVAALLGGALQLWRGEPYAELGETAEAVAERARLQERRLEAIEALTDARLEIGEHAAVVGRLEELVTTHPLREPFWAQLMLALYRSGRQADALDAYRRLRADLGDRLGLEPSPALRQLEQAILRQDASLDRGGSAPRFVGSGAPSATSPGRARAPGRAGAPDVARQPTAGNLHRPLSSFIGRRTELEELGDVLETHRLVTLVGPAGSGKTRLALELGLRVRDRYDDGAWLVELAALTTTEQALSAVVGAFGLRETPGRDPMTALADALRGRRLLLVVDNCEHLAGGVATVVGELLGRVDGLDVVATSREPLGVAGETLFEVPPLPAPTEEDPETVRRFDATRLLVERARSVSRPFAVTEDNAPALARICRRLDGMPLALELAAARLRAFTPQELADRLDDRFAVLVAAGRGGPARHQTLRAAVDWSFDLLDEPERTLFGRVSVFAGGFDLEAAEQVCAVEPLRQRDVVTALAALVDRSLVVSERRPGGGTRYRLLETLREYGQERLGAAEREALRRRHAEDVLRRAEAMASTEPGARRDAGTSALHADDANVRAAVRWAFARDRGLAVRLATALKTYWEDVGQRTEGARWLRQAVESTDGLPVAQRLATQLAACSMLHTSDMAASFALAQDALRQARQLGDERWLALALHQVAWSHTHLARSDEAIPLFREALPLFRSLGMRWEEVDCLHGLGEAVQSSDPDAAEPYLEQALAVARTLGDDRAIANSLFMLGSRVVFDDDPGAADEWLAEGLAIAERIGSVHAAAHARSRQGLVAWRRGRPAEAEPVLLESLARFREIGDRRCASRMLDALGRIAVDAPDHARATALLHEGLTLARDIGAPRVVVGCLDGLSEVALAAGDATRSLLLAAAARDLCTRLRLAIPASDSRRRDGHIGKLRGRLGADAVDAALRKVATMTRDEIIDEALAATPARAGSA